MRGGGELSQQLRRDMLHCSLSLPMQQKEDLTQTTDRNALENQVAKRGPPKNSLAGAEETGEGTC